LARTLFYLPPVLFKAMYCMCVCVQVRDGLYSAKQCCIVNGKSIFIQSFRTFNIYPEIVNSLSRTLGCCRVPTFSGIDTRRSFRILLANSGIKWDLTLSGPDCEVTVSWGMFLAYFPYFGNMKESWWHHLAVCFYMSLYPPKFFRFVRLMTFCCLCIPPQFLAHFPYSEKIE
jgi:hypothetical protein